MTDDFFTSEAFRELLAAVEAKHGPIAYFTVCNPQIPPIEEVGESEVTVICDHCQRETPLSDCVEVDERIGPDLLTYPVYLCFACDEELSEEELQLYAD